MEFLAVGLGGGLGAILRYSLGLITINHAFPFITFLINFSGAVVIGFVTGVSMSKGNLTPNQILFLKVGFCGGYTTFSSFSLEVFTLLEKGQVSLGILYALVSVITCVLGVYIGRRLS